MGKEEVRKKKGKMGGMKARRERERKKGRDERRKEGGGGREGRKAAACSILRNLDGEHVTSRVRQGRSGSLGALREVGTSTLTAAGEAMGAVKRRSRPKEVGEGVN